MMAEDGVVGHRLRVGLPQRLEPRCHCHDRRPERLKVVNVLHCLCDDGETEEEALPDRRHIPLFISLQNHGQGIPAVELDQPVDTRLDDGAIKEGVVGCGGTPLRERNTVCLLHARREVRGQLPGAPARRKSHAAEDAVDQRMPDVAALKIEQADGAIDAHAVVGTGVGMGVGEERAGIAQRGAERFQIVRSPQLERDA